MYTLFMMLYRSLPSFLGVLTLASPVYSYKLQSAYPHEKSQLILGDKKSVLPPEMRV
jgi:hypothetical protein